MPAPPPASAEASIHAPNSAARTASSFEGFLELDAAERERVLELVNGQVLEKTIGAYESCVASLLHFELRLFLRESGTGGFVLDDSTLYRCFEGPLVGRRPDVSFIAEGRIDAMGLRSGYLTIPPDLAVEVVSPNDLHGQVRAKEKAYLAAGVRMLWRVDTENREVTVHAPEGSRGPLVETDELSGGDVLPGFRLPVSRIFID